MTIQTLAILRAVQSRHGAGSCSPRGLRGVLLLATADCAASETAGDKISAGGIQQFDAPMIGILGFRPPSFGRNGH